MALDVLNWGCLLLWPWRRDAIEFTVQAGLAGPFVASALGFVAIALASLVDRASEVELVVAIAWLAYLVAKVLLKMVLVARHAPGASVWPTASPLRWRVVERLARHGELTTRYVQASFLPLLDERTLIESRHATAAPRVPLENAADAAAFTFLTHEVQELARRDLSLAVDVVADADGAWMARWFVLETHWGRECLGARVRVSRDGAYVAERARFPLPLTEARA